MERRFRYLDTLIQAFVVVLLISNLVAPKLTSLGPFVFSGAQLMFPITYIFGDVFTEVYGYAASRRAIWSGFFAAALMAGLGMVVVALPPAPGWHDQEAFAKVFGLVPRIVVASLVAYWCGEFANAFVMSKMKMLTSGKHLWMRTIGSTAVGQAVDTVVVMVIVFAGRVDLGTLINLMISGYGFKVIYEALSTPITYMVVNGLKRAEGVDVFDTQENFNPFKSVVS
ncbi:MAG: queuosine precursor transporter [Bryobacteraceae bacterium]